MFDNINSQVKVQLTGLNFANHLVQVVPKLMRALLQSQIIF